MQQSWRESNMAGPGVCNEHVIGVEGASNHGDKSMLLCRLAGLA